MSKPVGTDPSQDNLLAFAAKLRELRKRAGMTQQELAEAAFCSPDHVTKMERGVRLPSSHMLRLLLQTFSQHGLEQASIDQLEQLLVACKLNEPVVPVNLPLPPGVMAPAPLTPLPDTSLQAIQEQASAPPAEEEDLGITVQTAVIPLRMALDLKKYPSMRSLSNPYSFSEILGREAQKEELLTALQATSSPVVAITGLGGIGKSSLAYEVVEQAKQQNIFDEYIWESAKVQQLRNTEIEAVEFPSAWSQFSPSFSFEGLLDSLAFYFGRADLLTGAVSLETKLEQIAHELSQKRYLMVVDNLENCHNPRLVLVYLTQLLRQSGSGLLITSRDLPSYFEGYNLSLRGFNFEEVVGFLKHEARLRNISGLRDEQPDPEVTQALELIAKQTGGHPLVLKLVMRQLGTFSLERVLENVRTGYDEKAKLRYRPAGGLYSYIYKTIWSNLKRPTQKLLLKLRATGGATLTEAEMADLFGATPEDHTGFDVALAELVRYSLLEVSGVFQKRYSLHPLTQNFLQNGLIESWSLNGKRI